MRRVTHFVGVWGAPRTAGWCSVVGQHGCLYGGHDFAMATRHAIRSPRLEVWLVEAAARGTAARVERARGEGRRWVLAWVFTSDPAVLACILPHRISCCYDGMV
jgi:hypothetical protein